MTNSTNSYRVFFASSFSRSLQQAGRWAWLGSLSRWRADRRARCPRPAQLWRFLKSSNCACVKISASEWGILGDVGFVPNVFGSFFSRDQRAHRIALTESLTKNLQHWSQSSARMGILLIYSRVLVQRKSELNLPEGPKRCPVYLELPWKGPSSSLIARNIHSVVQSTYYSVNVNCDFTTSRSRLIWERTFCLPTNSATLSTSLNAGTAKPGMLVKRPKGYHRGSGSMLLFICLQKMHVQRDQPAGDPGCNWLPKRRTWRRFKCPIQPTLRRMKRFRQRHLKWPATAAATTAAPPSAAEPPPLANAVEVATAVVASATTTSTLDAASLNTPDITDQTIPAAMEEKNEVVQTRRSSLPRACKKT